MRRILLTMVGAVSADRIAINPDALRGVCRHYRVSRLLAYGSVVREDFRPGSDIDLLVEFEAGSRPTLFTLGGMIADLEDLLGREVDLKTLGDFPIELRAGVLASAELLYAAD